MGYISHLNEYMFVEFLSSLQVALNTLASSIKVLIVWAMIHRLDCAIETLDKFDELVTKRPEQGRIHRTVATCNRVVLYYILFYTAYVVSTFFLAVKRGRPPYQNYYPMLDWHANSLNFWLQLTLEFFSTLGKGFQNACVDCYPIVFILPLQTHIRIFSERLRQLGEDLSTPEERYRKLVDCIEYHKTILGYCDVLRPIISGTIFVQFLVLGLVIGFTVFSIMMSDDWGTLADALFESNWIEEEQRYKKTMQYFLQKLQQPIKFMAINVFPISLATNIDMMKFAMSVFAFMQKMRIVEKFSRHPHHA
ncbi:odorant receptor 42a-like [Scaptodrosophila lebanonensis]|uniref:Odorant receptor 42a-like n=1 Tax=Drosophila lebanonensis TaxID=7225 RepID=A0A6J2T0V6_DROLE|nr:odorant receptor 42a-like [Scaptodrosophila lebanonensis]